MTDVDQFLRRMADMHAVYRMYDKDSHLLYVGMTGKAGTRFGQHAEKRWFPLVARIDLEWFPTRAAAVLAERRAIQRERPRLNNVGRNWPRPVSSGHRGAPVLPVPEGPITDAVTLTQAVGFRLWPGSLDSIRKAAQRPGFPQRVGTRGVAALYDAASIAEFVAERR